MPLSHSILTEFPHCVGIRKPQIRSSLKIDETSKATKISYFFSFVGIHLSEHEFYFIVFALTLSCCNTEVQKQGSCSSSESLPGREVTVESIIDEMQVRIRRLERWNTINTVIPIPFSLIP